MSNKNDYYNMRSLRYNLVKFDESKLTYKIRKSAPLLYINDTLYMLTKKKKGFKNDWYSIHLYFSIIFITISDNDKLNV